MIGDKDEDAPEDIFLYHDPELVRLAVERWRLSNYAAPPPRIEDLLSEDTRWRHDLHRYANLYEEKTRQKADYDRKVEETRREMLAQISGKR